MLSGNGSRDLSHILGTLSLGISSFLGPLGYLFGVLRDLRLNGLHVFDLDHVSPEGDQEPDQEPEGDQDHDIPSKSDIRCRCHWPTGGGKPEVACACFLPVYQPRSTTRANRMAATLAAAFWPKKLAAWRIGSGSLEAKVVRAAPAAPTSLVRWSLAFC